MFVFRYVVAEFGDLGVQPHALELQLVESLLRATTFFSAPQFLANRLVLFAQLLQVVLQASGSVARSDHAGTHIAQTFAFALKFRLPLNIGSKRRERIAGTLRAFERIGDFAQLHFSGKRAACGLFGGGAQFIPACALLFKSVEAVERSDVQIMVCARNVLTFGRRLRRRRFASRIAQSSLRAFRFDLQTFESQARFSNRLFILFVIGDYACALR
jgi:hypothetical protein